MTVTVYYISTFSFRVDGELSTALLAIYFSPQKPHNMKKTACLFMESHFFGSQTKGLLKILMFSEQ